MPTSPSSSAAGEASPGTAQPLKRRRGGGPPLTRAEIAKRSRDRKAQQEHEMMVELTRLREQNRQLLIRSTRGLSRRSQEAERARVEGLSELVKMVRGVDKPNEREIGAHLKQYQDKYSDFGVERGSKVLFHLQQLRELLMPAEISRLFFTIMDHWLGAEDPPTFEGERSVSESWSDMAGELGVTEAQRAEFVKLKSETEKQTEAMRLAFKCIDDLEAIWNAKSETMGNKIVDRLTKVVAPSQAVKYLNWIENN